MINMDALEELKEKYEGKFITINYNNSNIPRYMYVFRIWNYVREENVAYFEGLSFRSFYGEEPYGNFTDCQGYYQYGINMGLIDDFEINIISQDEFFTKLENATNDFVQFAKDKCIKNEEGVLDF